MLALSTDAPRDNLAILFPNVERGILEALASGLRQGARVIRPTGQNSRTALVRAIAPRQPRSTLMNSNYNTISYMQFLWD